MKRLTTLILFCLLAVPMVQATTSPFYINNGVVSIIAPPQIAPVIDATTFVNNGLFNITNANGFGVTAPPPFETQNTLNYSNRNSMTGYSGWRFDYFDSNAGVSRRAANFANFNLVNDTNCNIFGFVYLLVDATNIVNRGALLTSPYGVVGLNGRNVDLTRSSLGTVGNADSPIAGVLDNYWGVAVNNFGPFFGFGVAQSGFLVATQIVDGLFYEPSVPFVTLTNGFNYYEEIFQTGITNYEVNAVLVANTNPAVTTEVRFDPFFADTRVVQFQTLFTNRANGLIYTNQVYVEDTLLPYQSFLTFNSNSLVQSPQPNYLGNWATTYHPANISVLHTYPGFAALDLMTNVTMDPTLFDGTGFPIPYAQTAYGAILTAASFTPNPSINWATYTNVPGRAVVTADKYLNLTRTRIDGQSYLQISASNHFVGSSNAQIISPVSDFNLRASNGTMQVANLILPVVPRMAGTLDCYSATWTNLYPSIPTESLISYRVTMINATISNQVPAQIQDCTLRATNLYISDELNVFRNFLIPDTLRLTITTNPPSITSLAGAINLESSDMFWSGNAPKLQFFTNFGTLAAQQTLYLYGARTPPWFTKAFDEPYQDIVNHGTISSQGNVMWANYFEFSGSNYAGFGPISLTATNAVLTNGMFLAPQADISVAVGSLFVSNMVFQAGHSFLLSVTNFLDDGSLASNSADSITNKNVWTIGDGIQFPILPPQASLLGTTITSTIPAYISVDTIWAGRDLGPNPAGFNNNAGVGRIVLNGGFDSLFEFSPIDLRLTFDDAVTNKVPAQPNLVNSGVYKPTNYSTNMNMPSVGIQHPYGTNLAKLNGGSPAGTWNLYVNERTNSGTGDSAQWYWSLTTVTSNKVGLTTTFYTNTYVSDFYYVPDGGLASPYPAPIVVPANATGFVAKVTATLTSPSQTFPEDIDVLLVAPGNKNVMLMAGTGTINTNRNALYVDSLELENWTGSDIPLPSGHDEVNGVQIDPNMRIYYGQALLNGVSVAEKLSGRNGGRFIWVSNYTAGFFSSTNLVYPDSTTNRFNTALVTSCTLDSNANGIPNCTDPTPIFVMSPSGIALSVTFTNKPTASALVSWNTMAKATNTIYYATSYQSTNWQVLTNFVSGPAGGRVTITDPLKTGAGRFYRARVIAP